ncbi:MAG: hypothetical protein AB1942_02160 [Pseudomonadota bacterium]
MSGLANLALAAALATAPQPAKGAEDFDRTPVRCRPAPYYVGDAQPRPKSQRLVITGTRVPLVRYQKRARPCHLMHAPTAPALEWRVVMLQELDLVRPSDAPLSTR